LAEDSRKGADFFKIRGFALEYCIASSVQYNLLLDKAPFSSIVITDQENFTWRVQGVFEKPEQNSESTARSDVDLVLVGMPNFPEMECSFDALGDGPLPEPPKPILVLGNFKMSAKQLTNPKDPYLKYLQSLDLNKWDAKLLLCSLEPMRASVAQTWQEQLTALDISLTVLPPLSLEAEFAAAPLPKTASAGESPRSVFVERPLLDKELREKVEQFKRVRIQGRKGVGNVHLFSSSLLLLLLFLIS
jgi:hypothetical protein